MIRLAFDTSTAVGSVALQDGSGRISEATIGTSVRHAESLLPAIAGLLEAAQLTPAALEGIVVGEGPGSFTGVRIAAATAKGMATALDLSLVPIGSLAAEARAAGVEDRPVCALFDARRGEVYSACHVFGDGVRTVLAPAARPIGDVVAAVPAGTVWTGEGVERYRGSLPAEAEIRSGAQTRAAALLRLASGRDGLRGRERTAWEPAYLRPSGAERMAP